MTPAPETAEAALRRSEAAADLGRFEEAAEEARAALAAQPCAAAFGALARAELGLDRPRAALKAADRGLALDPGSEWLLRLKSISLTRLGRHAESIRAAQEVVRLFPDLPSAHLGLGLALAGSGANRKAIAVLHRARALDPEASEVLRHIGDRHLALGEARAATRHYLASLAIEPRDPGALHNLGIALKKLERYEDAALAFESAVLVDPTFSPSKLELRATVGALKSRLDVRFAIPIAFLGPLLIPFIGEQERQPLGSFTPPGGASPITFWAAWAAGCAVFGGLVTLLLLWQKRRAQRVLTREPRLLAIYERLLADTRLGVD